ncbi:MAG: DUF2934 domain-containing protein [Candidatus Omnitrophota bacterium]
MAVETKKAGRISEERQMKIKISAEERQEMIKKRAQEIFTKRGNRPGDAMSDWLKAERIVDEEIKVSIQK